MNLNFFKNREAKTFMAWLYIIGGLAGLKASFALTIDKMELLKNPHFVPNCSINPIISCGSVMKTTQATVFGFDNSLLGLITFATIITVGVSLLAGADYKAWFWKLFNLGNLLGVILVHWFFFQSEFVIQAVCPWCALVWTVTIATFWYTLLYSLKQGYLKTPKPLATAVKFAQEYKHVILVVWYLAIAGSIVGHFWYYFKTVI